MHTKYGLIVLFCLLFAAPLQAYRTGDFSVAAAGVVSPLMLGSDFGEVNVEDTSAPLCHDAKLGKPGLGGELQARYLLTPHWAAGLSFSARYFASDLSSGWGLSTRTRMQTYMLFGQYILTPQSSYKLYIPFAAGLAHTDFSVNFRPLGYNNMHFSYTGFAYYAGLGAEKEISPHLSLALETRYTGTRFHDGRTRSDGHHVSVYNRANFLSFLLRVIYRV